MDKSKQGTELLIWDSSKKINAKQNNLIYWKNYDTDVDNQIFSISQIVENDAENLRLLYLKLIYDLGKSKIDGKSITDFLELRPNFSFWWMTLLSEKCNFAKSPQINNIIKLMAFEIWLKSQHYQAITIVSGSSQLIDAIELLAKKIGMGFNYKRTLNKRKKIKNPLKLIYKILPFSIRAILWFIYRLITRWKLKNVGINEWQNTKANITFVSYLFNLELNDLKRGKYSSSYWGELPELLIGKGISTNWLHLYVKDELVPTASSAAKIINSYNHLEVNNQVHVTLDSFLSFRIVLQVLGDWYKVFWLKSLVCKQIQIESDYLWPLFSRDCQESMTGPIAIDNLLNLNLFEAAMSSLPIQDKGFYLQENQGWEFGFIYSWQFNNHKNKLIGIPHSTVRYWDLRYFHDSRNYERNNICDMPIPNYVGVNGNAARNAYLSCGYPKDSLVDVEALRYIYLANINYRITEKNIGEKKILVLGDYLKENTFLQMKLLIDASKYINTVFSYIVKPHPACPINKKDYPELLMEVSNEPIHKLIKYCLLAFSGSVTSAAVDAYCLGKPVVTFLNPKGLNLSPLKGFEGVSFVSTPKELASILNNAEQILKVDQQGSDYFYLNSKLPKWTKLLLRNDKGDNKV